MLQTCKSGGVEQPTSHSLGAWHSTTWQVLPALQREHAIQHAHLFCRPHTFAPSRRPPPLRAVIVPLVQAKFQLKRKVPFKIAAAAYNNSRSKGALNSVHCTCKQG